MTAIDDVAAEDRVHSRFAPSALKRIIACPRSVVLGEAVAPGGGKSSVYAAEGSVAHRVAEAFLRGDGRLIDYPVGNIVEHEGHSIIVDADMHRYGYAYMQYVEGLRAEGDTLFIEETVRLNAIVGVEANMYGHLDACIWSPSRRLLIVVDYKYGRGIKVSALDNEQMKAYALGAMYSLPGIWPEDVQFVETHVFQPRVSGEPVHDTIHAVDILQWGQDELAPVVSAIMADGAVQHPYVTGDHCRFCPALAQCPAMRDRAVKAAQKAFADKPIPPSAWSDEELSDALKEALVVEIWPEAVREEAKRRFEKGRQIPDFKLVEGKGRRVWDDTDANVALALKTVFSLDESDFINVSLKSVAQVEKLIPVERREDFKNHMWINKSSGHVIVPASDKRVPVSVQPAHERFKNHPLPKEQ